MLLAAGALTAVLLVYLLAVAPVLSWRAEARDALSRSQALYEAVLPLAQRVTAQQGTRAEPPATLSVRAAATELARSLALDIIRLQGRGDSAVDISIGAGDPAILFRWLSDLQTRHGIGVTAAIIERADAGGLMQGAVTGRITLARESGS